MRLFLTETTGNRYFLKASHSVGKFFCDTLFDFPACIQKSGNKCDKYYISEIGKIFSLSLLIFFQHYRYIR